MADLAQQVDRQTPAQRRQISRELVDFETALIRNSGTLITIHLVDISPKGYHARCGGIRFERGEVTSLRLPHVGLLPGRIMWSLKGCFGAQFSVPIDARTYLELLTRIKGEMSGGSASAAR